MGIALETYRQWSDDPNLGALQVQDMSERTARAIYRSLYWNPLRADALSAGAQRPCGGPPLPSRSLKEGPLPDLLNNLLGNDT